MILPKHLQEKLNPNEDKECLADHLWLIQDTKTPLDGPPNPIKHQKCLIPTLKPITGSFFEIRGE